MCLCLCVCVEGGREGEGLCPPSMQIAWWGENIDHTSVRDVTRLSSLQGSSPAGSKEEDDWLALV